MRTTFVTLMAMAASTAVNGASLAQEGPQQHLSTIQNDSAMAQMSPDFDEGADTGLDLGQTEAQLAPKDLKVFIKKIYAPVTGSGYDWEEICPKGL